MEPIIDVHAHLSDILYPRSGKLIGKKGIKKRGRMDVVVPKPGQTALSKCFRKRTIEYQSGICNRYHAATVDKIQIFQ